MKLIIFGDSLMKGVTLKENGYGLLKDRDLTPPGWECLNLSKMGQTSRVPEAVLKKGVLFEPDAVAVELGGNDVQRDWDAVAEEPELDHRPAVELWEYLENLKKIKAAFPKAAFFTCELPPISSERFLNTISRGRNKENILRFLGEAETLSRCHEEYSRAGAAAGRRIDLRTPFLHGRDPGFLCPDGIHLSQSGFRLMRSLFFRGLPAAQP